MAVNRGSRYEYASVDYLPVGFDKVKAAALFYSFDTIGSIKYQEYTWLDGDRPDLVAEHFYGASELWWVIAEHNPQISDITNIVAGTTLRIPIA